MERILFVCHGNICRSPMAEIIFRTMAQRRGVADRFVVASCATSREELGNPIYPPARRQLEAHGYPCPARQAVQLKRTDYGAYDRFYIMDQRNLREILAVFGGDPQSKIELLSSGREIEDPWYSGRFDAVFRQIEDACRMRLDERIASTSDAVC